METILKIKDFIEYVFNYKDNVKEMDSLDRELDNYKMRYAKKSKRLEELEETSKIYEERWDDYLSTIREKNKQIRQLKKRDKKLKQIEEMFENKKVVLRDLKELVKGE